MNKTIWNHWCWNPSNFWCPDMFLSLPVYSNSHVVIGELSCRGASMVCVLLEGKVMSSSPHPSAPCRCAEGTSVCECLLELLRCWNNKSITYQHGGYHANYSHEHSKLLQTLWAWRKAIVVTICYPAAQRQLKNGSISVNFNRDILKHLEETCL